MAIITPPTITPVPLPVPHRSDPANFSPAMDANVDWQAAAPPQFQAVADNVVHNATEAMNSATAAAGSVTAAAAQVTAATSQAGTATAQAGTAATQAGIATTKAAEAAASATAAASSAAALLATSSTPQAIGTGTFVFATQAGKQFANNIPVTAVDQANAANYISGTVASYTGTTLTLTGTSFGGSGSISSWNISVSGVRGAIGLTGGVTGGNLTGALNEKQVPSAVAVSATPDIWSGAGNSLRVDGTGTITGFPNAPQAGAKRTILIGSGPVTFQTSANMVMSGGTQTAVQGDLVDVLCMEGLGVFYVTIRKRDGTPAVGAKQYMVLLTSGSTWTVDASTFEVEVQAGGQYGYKLTAGSKQGGAAGWCGIKRYRDAVLGATAVISVGGVGAPGTTSTNPGPGGSTSFALSGFTTLTASATGVSGADMAYPPRPGANSVDITYDSTNFQIRLLGQGGDSRNGFGGEASTATSDGDTGNVKNGYGYGAGGGGQGGAGTGGCIIIRYFK